MNWKRGLFRVWLLFSALWIAACVGLGIVTGRMLEANRTYEIIGPNNERVDIVAPPTATNADVIAFYKQNQRPDCSKDKTGPWCDHPVQLKMPGKQFPPFLIYLALGVPIATFILGGSLYWALAGFSRS